MRLIYLCIFFFLTVAAHAQVEYIPLSSDSQDSRIESPLLDTISLPFWDDFSKSNQLDTSLWIFGFDTFINNTLAIQAPTKNVASFDGLNQVGYPHLIESEFNGASDSLVSQAIDLTLVEKEDRNTIYLSFYWQMKGRGDLPNEEDSLRLQFKNKYGEWITQNINPDPDLKSLAGGLSKLIFDEDSIQAFTQVVVAITDSFIHEGFQFKFESFTSLNGIYDAWHIDYIYLNSNRSSNDLLHFDRSLSNLENSLFYPYTSFPIEQADINNDWVSQESFVLSNLDNSPHPARYSYQVKNLTTGNDSEVSFITPVDMRPLEIGRTELAPSVEIPGLSVIDSMVIETEITYLTGDKRLFEEVTPSGDTLFLAPDLKSNDTLRTRYTLHNYLAYDDGTAELAAGINLNQGQLAVRYYVSSPDTLTDILIYFPPIFPSTIGESITLRVWSELDILALTREFGGVIEATEKNSFQRFSLATPVIVRDTFFIGYQQFTDNYIGIGLDKNNIGGSPNIYSNTNREWVQNDRIAGSLMIRPVFRSAAEYVLSAPSKSNSLTIFPNPTTSHIGFSATVSEAFIQTLSGKIITKCQHCTGIDLFLLEPGIYLISLIMDGSRYTEQLIIQ